MSATKTVLTNEQEADWEELESNDYLDEGDNPAGEEELEQDESCAAAYQAYKNECIRELNAI